MEGVAMHPPHTILSSYFLTAFVHSFGFPVFPVFHCLLNFPSSCILHPDRFSSRARPAPAPVPHT
eukprot:759587-Hanusia_phi.AAC.1